MAPPPGSTPSRTGGFLGTTSPGPMAELYGAANQDSGVSSYISAASPAPSTGFGHSLGVSGPVLEDPEVGGGKGLVHLLGRREARDDGWRESVVAQGEHGSPHSFSGHVRMALGVPGIDRVGSGDSIRMRLTISACMEARFQLRGPKFNQGTGDMQIPRRCSEESFSGSAVGPVWAGQCRA